MRANSSKTAGVLTPNLPGPEGLAISETIAAIERYHETRRRYADAYARYEAIGDVGDVPYEVGSRWEKWTDAAHIAMTHAESELIHCIQAHREEVRHIQPELFGDRQPYAPRAVAHKDFVYVSAQNPDSDKAEAILIAIPKSAITDLQAEPAERKGGDL